jgi:hypothetical protein
MNKKILLVSIIAVVILVLVSFTGVVGYQTTKSSTIAKISPLFNIRTSRALGEESKDIACNYVGKGNTLPFPERDDRTILTQKIIDRISKIDDKSFERFIASFINNAQKDNRFKGINPDEIREALYLIRDSDKPIPIFDANTEYKRHTIFCGCITCSCITSGHGSKGFLNCILLPLILTIFIIDSIFWCFHIGVSGALNSICVECPITLRKLS